MISIVILTGNELRHRFFARSLSHNFKVLAAVYEQKANVHQKRAFSPEDLYIVEQHFNARNISEKSYFSKLPENLINTEIEIFNGEINTEENVGRICSLNPEYILLFGSSLIKAPLLEQFPNKVINLHLGLSPYYRGSGTNFWPLVHCKPECVGATIHLATLKVDAGDILYQVRPQIDEKDTIHDLGNKTILEAIKVIPETVLKYKEGKIQPSKQDIKGGFECKRKDLNAMDIALMYENFATSMIKEYLENIAERQSKYPIQQPF